MGFRIFDPGQIPATIGMTSPIQPLCAQQAQTNIDDAELIGPIPIEIAATLSCKWIPVPSMWAPFRHSPRLTPQG